MEEPNEVRSDDPASQAVEAYVVLHDWGKVGRIYRKTEEKNADRSILIARLMSEHYRDPIIILAFTADGQSRDITVQIAQELFEHAKWIGAELHAVLRSFVYYEIDRAKRVAFSNAIRAIATERVASRTN